MGALTHNGEVLQSLPANASQINFDKTGTDLNATQTEAAIKEVNGKVNTNAENITQLKSGLTNVTTTQITETGATGIARKFLKVVMLDIYDGDAVTAAANDVLFVLPIGYRPSMPLSVLNAYGSKVRLNIETNGNVVAKDAITAEPLRFSATYVVE